MTAISEPRTLLDRLQLFSVRQLLRDYFAAEFALWGYVDGQWQRVAPEAANHRVPADPEAQESLHLAIATPGSPTMVRDAGGTPIQMIVPLPKQLGVYLAATVPFGEVSQSRVEHLAKLFLRHLATQDELIRLRQEHHGLLWQVTNDFEELTFLRNVAGMFETCDLKSDVTTLTHSMLSKLQPLLEADAVLLVGDDRRTNRSGSATSDLAVHIWVGKRCVGEELCLQLVRMHAESAATRPVVKNFFDKSADGAAFPGINSFILVPAVNVTTTIGWLLALNRNNSQTMEFIDVHGDASYLEFGTHEATLMSSSAAILAAHTCSVDRSRERDELLTQTARTLATTVADSADARGTVDSSGTVLRR